jgi:hypothetical protein
MAKPSTFSLMQGNSRVGVAMLKTKGGHEDAANS